ncbi:MAG TPA: DMT family transporter [Terriglobales bacterium]|nr:DMT family transporter [Terriglobales bacterium]
MTIFALALILTAAVFHATWNLINKQASGHATFTWIVAVLSGFFYAPATIAVIEIFQIEITSAAVGVIAGSAVLHSAYFVLLNQGYRAGDLSLVYPLARGTGPLLACIAAILFLGERPSLIAVLGALLIIAGVVALSGNLTRLRERADQTAVRLALLTGLFIAGYTLWDKQAVSLFGVAPLVLDWGANVGRAILLAPFALKYADETNAEWREHKYEAIAIAVLIPLAYILVLTAMTFTPVSYVAPAREISVLIGTVMGARLLAEADAPRRLAAAGAMVLGIIGLAIG